MHEIVKATKKVFIKKGIKGDRIQQIADEAGINKAYLISPMLTSQISSVSVPKYFSFLVR